MFADIGSWLQKTGLNCPRPPEGVEGETEGGAAVAGEGPEGVTEVSDARLLDTGRGETNAEAGRQGKDCFLGFTDTYCQRRRTASHGGRCLQHLLGAWYRQKGREGEKKEGSGVGGRTGLELQSI